MKTEFQDLIDVAGELLAEFDACGEVLQTDEKGRYGPASTIERLRRAKDQVELSRKALVNGRPHACRHAARRVGAWLGERRPATQLTFIQTLLQFCSQDVRDQVGESYFNADAAPARIE